MKLDKRQQEEVLKIKTLVKELPNEEPLEIYLFLKKSLEQTIIIASDKENIQFSTIVSRLIFVSHKFDIPRQLVMEVQRNLFPKDDSNLFDVSLSKRIVMIFIDVLLEIPTTIEERYTDSVAPNFSPKLLRVQVVSIDKDNLNIDCVCTEDYSTHYIVEKDTSKDGILHQIFDSIWIGAQLNLINYTISGNKICPLLVVLEPDYLIDASRIGECFQNFATSPYLYLLSKLEQSQSSKHLLLGNLANFILDESISSSEGKDLEFNDVFLKSFKQMPFEYTVCKDIESTADFKLFMDDAKRHFINIQRVVKEDFPSLGFDFKQCVLEPSFYSEKYGFQGRLDLLQQAQIGEPTQIVELKSGKTPYPQNIVTKVALNHEAQIAVYRLMIESVYNLDFTQISSMALYSSADVKGQNLRYVTPNLAFYKKILAFRNQIITNEYLLYSSSLEDIEKLLLEVFKVDNYSANPPDFFKEKISQVAAIYYKSSKLERIYFLRFFKFITRELYTSKIGDSDSDKSLSLAALWNTSLQDRKNNLELIDGLSILEIIYDEVGMNIIFESGDESGIENTNFREGDICVVYPNTNQRDRVAILSTQILKGTIVVLNDRTVIVRFRFKQKNTNYLNKSYQWVIEHDKLDHSMNAMFRSLYSFLAADQRKKNLLLGLEKPNSAFDGSEDILDSVDQQKDKIINKALSAQDYFLIVGPPGTGKTSVFAKTLISKIFTESEDNILVVAYTNRAVDELCSAVLAACDGLVENDNLFIRIGSSNNCDTKYTPFLLSTIASQSKSRQELIDKLRQTRIYIGTLASIVGKPELFTFKHFHVALIDEASQILEPQIIGILPQVDKFILIGDHKQLSTISLQTDAHSEVREQELQDIELLDCKESIFERLYRIVTKNEWIHAYDTLYFHGRMHQDIASIINQPFYNGILKTITDRQIKNLEFDNKSIAISELQNKLSTHRTSFFHVVNNNSVSSKINEPEAKLVADIVESIIELYELNHKSFDIEQTIGIITPYRNQIATIKSMLRTRNILNVEKIMIDTVERYQGSQRDIIIVSFCFNNVFQMNNFANMDKDNQVDRKLNVALSRAREQMFLVGNKNILNKNPLYAKVLNL